MELGGKILNKYDKNTPPLNRALLRFKERFIYDFLGFLLTLFKYFLLFSPLAIGLASLRYRNG